MAQDMGGVGCFLLELALGDYLSSFNLEKAVCNHGFFMMEPNNWIPSTKTLQRPLRLSNTTNSVIVSIFSHPTHQSLIIKVHEVESLSLADQAAIKEQVCRMLRLSEKDERDVKEFQGMHSEAKEKGFGRLFRSPSLFEDTVKSILLCNCSWQRSLKMAEALCKLQSELFNALDCKNKAIFKKRAKKRKVAAKEEDGDDDMKLKSSGNFPSSRELAKLGKGDEDMLKMRCKLGYRAKIILKIAKSVENGRLKLNDFEESLSYQEEVANKLMKIKGFGPFATANVLMCMGFYQKVPADTETIRLLKQVHGKKSCKKTRVEQEANKIYDKYAPFQCLAYWLELLYDYEDKFGKLSELPKSNYYTINGHFHLREVKKNQDIKLSIL